MGGVRRDGCVDKEDRRRKGRQRPMGKVEREKKNMCRRVIKQKKRKGGWEERESGKRAGDKS